jgi:hypothetical protein
MHCVRIRVVESKQDRGDERAVSVLAHVATGAYHFGSARTSEDDAPSTGNQCLDTSQYIVSLFNACEWTHCCALCTRIAEHSTCVDSLGYCIY